MIGEHVDGLFIFGDAGAVLMAADNAHKIAQVRYKLIRNGVAATHVMRK
jgi:hypothetical protein